MRALVARRLDGPDAIELIETAVPEILDQDPVVAVVDNFGNCKLDRDLGLAPGEVVTVAQGNDALVDVTCYPHLTAVPRNSPGIIPGSSGTGFTELVIRGGSAAEAFGLQPGDPLSISVAEKVA